MHSNCGEAAVTSPAESVIISEYEYMHRLLDREDKIHVLVCILVILQTKIVKPAGVLTLRPGVISTEY